MIAFFPFHLCLPSHVNAFSARGDNVSYFYLCTDASFPLSPFSLLHMCRNTDRRDRLLGHWGKELVHRSSTTGSSIYLPVCLRKKRKETYPLADSCRADIRPPSTVLKAPQNAWREVRGIAHTCAREREKERRGEKWNKEKRE